MTIPKKGSRLITVNGVKYRWLIRKKATYSQVDYGIGFLHVAVDLNENPGTTLVIFSNHKHPNDFATEKIIAITPVIVSTWILEAINLGWQPNTKGRQFLVNIDENNTMITV